MRRERTKDRKVKSASSAHDVGDNRYEIALEYIYKKLKKWRVGSVEGEGNWA